MKQKKIKKLMAVVLSCAMLATSVTPVLADGMSEGDITEEPGTPKESGIADEPEYSEPIYHYEYIDIQPGDGETTLDASTAGIPGDIYQWYRDGEIIEAAEGAVYTVDVQETCNYECDIYSDNDSNPKGVVYFHLTYQTGLQAWGDGTDGLQTVCYALKEGETRELSVEASIDDGVEDQTLHYEWGQYKEVEDEYGNSYTDWYKLEEGIDKTTYTVTGTGRDEEYICQVSDSYGNSVSVWFQIENDSGITISAVETYFECYPGEPAKLEVSASSEYGYKLTYQWYRNEAVEYKDENGEIYTELDWKQIDGATDPVYEIEAVEEDGEYLCKVTDEKGNSKKQEFYVSASIDVHFVDWSDSRTMVFPGGEVTLSAEAEANVVGAELSYQWRTVSYDEDDCPIFEDIEGATKSTLKVKPDETATYSCKATATYGKISAYTEKRITVYVIQKEDAVTELPEADAYGYMYFEGRFEDAYDVRIYKLQPKHTCQYSFDVNIGRMLLADGDGKVIDSRSVLDKGAAYYLVLLPEDGDFLPYSMNMVQNAVTGLEIEDYESDVRLSVDNKASLTINATVNEGLGISYQWYRYEENEEKDVIIEGATANTYEATAAGFYWCELTITEDGDVLDVWGYDFKVDKYSPLTVKRESDDSMEVPYGKSTTMRVSAKSDDNDPITYQWYRGNVEDWKEKGVLIDGATDASYTWQKMTNHEYFYVEVTSGKETEKVVFWRYVDIGAAVRASQSNYSVTKEGTVCLAVIPTTDVKEEGVVTWQYEWYFEDGSETGKKIEGATGDTLTVKGSDLFGVYGSENISEDEPRPFSCNAHAYIDGKCVCDRYVWMSVSLSETGLNASSEQDGQWVKLGETLLVNVSMEKGTASVIWSCNDKRVDTREGVGSGVYEFTPKTAGVYNCEVFGRDSSNVFSYYVYDPEAAEKIDLDGSGSAEKQIMLSRFGFYQIKPSLSGMYRIGVDGKRAVTLDMMDGNMKSMGSFSYEENYGFEANLKANSTYYLYISDDVAGYKTNLTIKKVDDIKCDHQYAAPKFKWSSDNKASAVFTCADCGHEETPTAEVTSKATAATCTAEGKTVYTATVTFNGKKYTGTKEVPIAKKAHTYGTAVASATTKADGSITEKCAVCGSVKSKTAIAKIGAVKLSKTSMAYTGKNLKPSVTVKDGSGKAISSQNYTVAYKNNKAVGTASVTITFKGNYSGMVTKTFTICPKAAKLATVSAKSKGFQAKWKKVSGITGYEVQYSLSAKFPKKQTVTKNMKASEKSLKVGKLKKKKKYYVRIRTYKTVKGKKIYSEWSAAKKVTTKK